MKSVEFRGYTNVEYVEQPPGSEQCFAAIISGVSGVPIHESQAALYDSNLVDENGGVGGLFMETSLQVGTNEVAITPLEAADGPETVLDQIDEQLNTGKAVALLYKKTANPEDGRYHWILLTGYHEVESEKGAFLVMDPLRDSELDPVPVSEEIPDTLGMRYVARQRIIDFVRQSTDYDRQASDGSLKSLGIFPHVITTDAGSSPGPVELTIEPKFDQEPKPIEDTYAATQQDKIKALP
jgi:hypothetical protein